MNMKTPRTAVPGTRWSAAFALALGAVFVMSGCKKKEEAPAVDTTAVAPPAPVAMHVSGVETGKGINADKTVKDDAHDFGGVLVLRERGQREHRECGGDRSVTAHASSSLLLASSLRRGPESGNAARLDRGLAPG